jgi:hypothetical protein
VCAAAALTESSATLVELRVSKVGNERGYLDVIEMMVRSRFTVASPDTRERSKKKPYASSLKSLPAPLQMSFTFAG